MQQGFDQGNEWGGLTVADAQRRLHHGSNHDEGGAVRFGGSASQMYGELMIRARQGETDSLLRAR